MPAFSSKPPRARDWMVFPQPLLKEVPAIEILCPTIIREIPGVPRAVSVAVVGPLDHRPRHDESLEVHAVLGPPNKNINGRRRHADWHFPQRPELRTFRGRLDLNCPESTSIQPGDHEVESLGVSNSRKRDEPPNR